MKALIQRVLQASVVVDGAVVGQIDHGLLVFLAVIRGDGPEQVDKMVGKVAGMRIFPDGEGKMNRSVKDVGGSVLVVSQFTLAAELNKGYRPSFSQAADPQTARKIMETFCENLRHQSLNVATGRFGADMKVHLVNDGPVTFWLDFPGG
ncbi:MAG: D-tyrosyl-tRNA(Tyr) deacylase [Magnetococcales bacterium]|nr:D-tyrosyl-tRNA(Tyr) deacylase [Magnetococcales bacterium]